MYSIRFLKPNILFSLTKPKNVQVSQGAFSPPQRKDLAHKNMKFLTFAFLSTSFEFLDPTRRTGKIQVHNTALQMTSQLDYRQECSQSSLATAGVNYLACTRSFLYQESFAEERSDCQGRMDRLSLKERIELERQQARHILLLYTQSVVRARTTVGGRTVCGRSRK
jgi:hypothetical protein